MAFEVNPDDTKKTWDEFVRVLPKMWMEDEFEWQGKAFSHAVAERAAETAAGPAPAALGDRNVTGHRTRRRGSGTRLPRRLRRGLRGTGASHQREYHRRVRNCDPVGGMINDQVHTMNFPVLP